MKKALFRGIAGAVTLAAGMAIGSPYPLPLWHITFNDDTIGDPPSTMSTAAVSLTEINTRPTGQSATQVVSQYATVGDTLADQPIYIDYSEGGTTPRLRGTFRTLAGTSVSNYQFEADVLIDNANIANALSIYFYNTEGTAAANLIGGVRLSLPDDGRITLFSGGNSLNIDNQWSPQTTFRYGLFLDAQNARMQAMVNGSVVGTVDIPSEHLSGEGLKLGEWDFRNISTNARWEGGIDNITTQIPEPGTLLLAGFGLLGLRLLRKRR